ncbi:MAG: hypothetical protein H8E98_04590, partial [Bacteroidetes bacterium]|nr:hypothetical protein [Bacteroidota bacterium]
MNTNNLIAHSYSYDHNGFSYSAAFYDLDTATISDDLILNNLIGGTIRRANVSTDTIVNITYKGYPGKEAFVYSSDGTEGRIRFILIDNRKVYMLIVTNDGTKSIHNQQVEMFLNSFYIDIEERSNTVESTGTSTLPFGNKLTIRQLIQLLYTDIGYSQDMLIMGGWEP